MIGLTTGVIARVLCAAGNCISYELQQDLTAALRGLGRYAHQILR